MITTARQVRPFLKWAGGKGQLIEQIAAVSICYQVIQKNVKKLGKELGQLESQYLSKTDSQREKYFYEKRDEFNECLSKKAADSLVRRSALLIFLNKTCFNGLYRVNSSGEFNVPFGRYKNPTICHEENLYAVHEISQMAEIVCGDFALCLEKADSRSFVYFDPPYRPISPTANFNSYAKDAFDDSAQKRLRKVFGDLDKKDAYVMLSNSDPKNGNSGDNFFDVLYRGYHIERLTATRLINCNADRRGEITEILVTNY